ncbi:MAG: methyltransferase domain-containing protein [Pseudomonadota bacterium]
MNLVRKLTLFLLLNLSLGFTANGSDNSSKPTLAAETASEQCPAAILSEVEILDVVGAFFAAESEGPKDLDSIRPYLYQLRLAKVAEFFTKLRDHTLFLQKKGMAGFLGSVFVDHPASFEDRSQLIRTLFAVGEDDRRGGHNNIAYQFLDEIMGLPKSDLEVRESSEREILGDEQSGILGVGRTHDFWFTNHESIRQLIEVAEKDGRKHIVDLGCGTGRVGLLLAFLKSEIRFTGVDLVESRIEAANRAVERFGLTHQLQFRVQDLLNHGTDLPDGDFYFMYGPTNDSSINEAVVDRVASMHHESDSVLVGTQHHMTRGILSRHDSFARETNYGGYIVYFRLSPQ